MTELTKQQIDLIAGPTIKEYPEDMVSIFTITGKYLFLTSNHKKYVGFDSGELIGKNLTSLITAWDMPHILIAQTDTMFSSKSVEIGTHLKNKNGGMISVRAVAQVYEDPGSGKKYVIGRCWPSRQE